MFGVMLGEGVKDCWVYLDFTVEEEGEMGVEGCGIVVIGFCFYSNFVFLKLDGR